MKTNQLKITILGLLFLTSGAYAGIGVCPCVYFPTYSGPPITFTFSYRYLGYNGGDRSCSDTNANNCPPYAVSFIVSQPGVTCAPYAGWIGTDIDTDNDHTYDSNWNISYAATAKATAYSGSSDMRIKLARTGNPFNSSITLSNETNGATICSQSSLCPDVMQYLNNGDSRYIIFKPSSSSSKIKSK